MKVEIGAVANGVMLLFLGAGEAFYGPREPISAARETAVLINLMSDYGEAVTGELTIRLSFGSADQSLVDRIVEALRSAGFQIHGSSMRGIDARASREVIERFFEVPVCDAGQPRFNGEPKFDRLPQEANYRAYFPRPPQLF